jgi:hypothetical protein
MILKAFIEITKVFISLCCLLTVNLYGSTTISGSVKGLSNSTITSGIFIRFYLRGCSGNVPRISGTALVPTSGSDAWYKDFIPDPATGAISGTLYSTRDSAGTGNGEIECGGSYTTVWYGMGIWRDGIAGPETPVHAKNGAILDISKVTAWTTNTVSVAPSGHPADLQENGSNSRASEQASVSARLETKSLNGIIFANQFANLAAIQADIGSANPAHVVIPSQYSGTDCPALQNNTVFEDYRAGGRSGTRASSYICTNNIIQYNTKTPGGTDALIRTEISRKAVDPTGSVVAFYPIAHLINGTGGSTLDGSAPLAELDGSITGKQDYMQGSEMASSIRSTGGTVTNAAGGVGYVTNGGSSTTAITNAYGLWGRGCAGVIHGVAPLNCYGGFFSRQLGAASSRNYSIVSEGLSLFMYDTNAGVAGFDCEDKAHATFPCFRVSGSDRVVIQAKDATQGVTIADSTGVGRYVFNNSSFTVTNPMSVSSLAMLIGGFKAGASGSTISDSRELVQSARSCGTTTSCANTPHGSNRMIFGTVRLSAGTATISGINPAFTSTESYVCTATDQSSALAVKIANASNSSFTIGGNGTDVIGYQCIGD